MKTWKKIALTLAGCATLALGGYFLTRDQKEEPKIEQTAKFTEEDYNNLLEIEQSRMNFIKDREDKPLEMLLNFANDLKRIEGYKRAEEYINERRFLDAAEEFESNEFYAEAGFMYYNLGDLCMHIEANDVFFKLMDQGASLIEAVRKSYDMHPTQIHLAGTSGEIPVYKFHNPNCRFSCEPMLDYSLIVEPEEGRDLCKELENQLGGLFPSYEKSVEMFKEEGMFTFAGDTYMDFKKFEEAKDMYLNDGNYKDAAEAIIDDALEHSGEAKNEKLMYAYELAMEHGNYTKAVKAQSLMGDYKGLIETVENFILGNSLDASDSDVMKGTFALKYARALINTGQRDKAERFFGERLKEDCLMAQFNIGTIEVNLCFDLDLK